MDGSNRGLGLAGLLLIAALVVLIAVASKWGPGRDLVPGQTYVAMKNVYVTPFDIKGAKLECSTLVENYEIPVNERDRLVFMGKQQSTDEYFFLPPKDLGSCQGQPVAAVGIIFDFPEVFDAGDYFKPEKEAQRIFSERDTAQMLTQDERSRLIKTALERSWRKEAK